jgi:hypothetical protein
LSMNFFIICRLYNKNNWILRYELIWTSRLSQQIISKLMDEYILE